MLKNIFIFLSISTLIVIGFGFSNYTTGAKRYVQSFVPSRIVEVFAEPSYFDSPPKYITIDSLHYSLHKASFKTLKSTLKTKYKNAKNNEEKNIVLTESADLLFSNLADSLIPYWYGTPWDYNGISQKPGSGQIACGYFVFTLLRDAGVKLPRIKMSQAASEQAIKSLVPKEHIKRFSNIPLATFIEKIKTWGNGFYIIGLDNHVGLYQVTDEESWFIHSTVIYPSCVIKEKAETSLALDFSSYRVIGKLSNNHFLTKKWLFDEFIVLN